MADFDLNRIVEKALRMDFLSKEEGLFLYHNMDLTELMWLADQLRKKIHPNKQVSWMVDRNVNITNVCISGCLFCNFHCKYGDKQAYITSMEAYEEKIKELFEKGGNQLLLQGGMHPKLKLEDYESLFRELKKRFPSLKLHALGPPEIVHLTKIEKLDVVAVLKRLMIAGLDSLPGAGAEVLSDRVRMQLSKYKCSSKEWLDVMREAHKLGLLTSATMMFGHIETLEERMEHLIQIRQVQKGKPSGEPGFMAFICWPFQSEGTKLLEKHGVVPKVSGVEYIKMLALSRIMLPNIPNIQASWLTVGYQTAQMALYAGANDMGSIMIEENVVSAAGADYQINAEGMQRLIREAGFVPVKRNQAYQVLNVDNSLKSFS